jgi:hypothetical protein
LVPWADAWAAEAGGDLVNPTYGMSAPSADEETQDSGELWDLGRVEAPEGDVPGERHRTKPAKRSDERMSTEKNYWESVEVDPLNHCPLRGEYPHVGCEVEMYEFDPTGCVSHLYGACHAHRMYWHLQSGGSPVATMRGLYEHVDADYSPVASDDGINVESPREAAHG